MDEGCDDNPLEKMPCKCPRSAHSKCIARWQLQSAGTRKETHCEFCDTELPGWKDMFLPAIENHGDPVMNVTFNGVTRGFRVSSGPEGYRKFSSEIQKAFKLPHGAELSITFTCDEPTGVASQLVLKGEGAYDAAVLCAAVSAARRAASESKARTVKRRSSLVDWKIHIGKAIPSVSNLTRRITCALSDLSCKS